MPAHGFSIPNSLLKCEGQNLIEMLPEEKNFSLKKKIILSSVIKIKMTIMASPGFEPETFSVLD